MIAYQLNNRTGNYDRYVIAEWVDTGGQYFKTFGALIATYGPQCSYILLEDGFLGFPPDND